jgi:biotin carboxyl carrier protein
MRYYLIDSENNDTIIDLEKTKIHHPQLMEFDFSIIKDNKERSEEKKVWVKRLANKYFTSLDGKTWYKIAKQDLPDKMLNVNQVFKLYRGFKPSGLSNAAEGDLITQMPGKVVKVLVEEGAEIKKGDTLLILEAMKMENEIKAPCDGTIKAVHINEGDAIESGHLMMEIQ